MHATIYEGRNTSTQPFFPQMNPMANELPTGDGWLADAREFDEGDVDDAYCAETEPNSDDEMELVNDEDVVEEDDSPVGDDEDQPDSGGEAAADEPGGPQPPPGSLCSLFYFYFYSFPFLQVVQFLALVPVT